MKRSIDKELLNWKADNDRKILLVRGARQVGKTYSLKKLGETFPYLLQVNFEETPEIKRLFQTSLNPSEICEKLTLFYDVPIIPGETLLLLDEIQACPEALKSLRFFYEKMPGLHVAAAGSLLEFALAEIPSFGVGRIESLFMYPMTFSEFLIASGHERLEQLIRSSSAHHPIDSLFHEKILDKLKIFMIIGGMPASVDSYIKHNDLNRCQKIIDNLITNIIDDFAKYSKKSSALRLQEVFYAVVQQMGGKFKYSHVSASEVSSHAYKDALELLIKAGIVHRVYHTAARGLPLGAQSDPKKFKILIMDTGIYQRILGLDLAQYIIADFKTLINRGCLSELFVGLELIAHQSPFLHPQLHYWHREAKASNAEVDYIIPAQGKVVPVEVKAGTKGQMQSLFLFLNERNLPWGVRVSAENFADYERIHVIPIYAVNRIANICKE